MFDASFYPESALAALEALPAGRRTASANGSAIDIKTIEGNLLVALSSSAAAAGTNPTLDVKFQERVDATDAWADVPDEVYFNPADNSAGVSAKFAQVTNAASFQIRGLKRQYLKAQLRAVATIGGTSTPTFDLAVVVIGQDRYTDR